MGLRPLKDRRGWVYTRTLRNSEPTNTEMTPNKDKGSGGDEGGGGMMVVLVVVLVVVVVSPLSFPSGLYG